MKYTIGLSSHRNGWWELRRDSILLMEGTESEVTIASFALNKAASNQGGVLAYVRDEGDWDEYDGPTTL